MVRPPPLAAQMCFAQPRAPKSGGPSVEHLQNPGRPSFEQPQNPGDSRTSSPKIQHAHPKSGLRIFGAAQTLDSKVEKWPFSDKHGQLFKNATAAGKDIVFHIISWP